MESKPGSLIPVESQILSIEPQRLSRDIQCFTSIMFISKSAHYICSFFGKSMPSLTLRRYVTIFLFSRFGSQSRDAKCREQKLLLHCRLELMSESPESGALSLSSAARHIDFHSLRRIYVVLVAHSIALSLHLYTTYVIYCTQYITTYILLIINLIVLQFLMHDLYVVIYSNY